MNTAIIKNPDEVICTMQFTMKIKDWKQVRKTLRNNAAYTELQIINEISDLVYKLEAIIYPDYKDLANNETKEVNDE